MRKQVLIYALLIFCNLSLTAQNYRGESWYRNYFKEHLEELDPIEGIYSVVSKVAYTHGATESYDFNGVVCIMRNSNTYRIVHLSGDDVCNDIELRRVGETNVYNITKYWNGCSETSPGRIYLNNIYSFDFQYEAPPCFMRILEKARVGNERYAAYAKFKTQCAFVKEYPTRSMYEEAIAKAQRKIEEESQPSTWSGSGWAIGDGYLVTNHHVVDGARTISIKGIGGDLNTGYNAEVVATDKTNDIAVLKITDHRFKGFGTIPYAVSSRIADKGEGVFVLGYPMTQVLGNEVKYTAGEINSRTGFQGDVATYQISAPVTHGNSGGPMFDNRGNVIGIVNSGITDKEIAENVGYAIKISYLKILIESAGLNITLPQNNTIANLSKQEKIKKVEKFVYYIECSK